MAKLKTYDCGNGDGMFENGDKGFYVEKKDYLKLEQYKDALFELASINCSGLAYDDLYELAEKYGDA
jgi:hypothetical protein